MEAHMHGGVGLQAEAAQQVEVAADVLEIQAQEAQHALE
jgi:hypothetical protein